MNSNYNTYQKYSFQHQTKIKVLQLLEELKEIKEIPEEQKSMHALNRQNYIEQKIKYYLVPVKQKLTVPTKLLDQQYITYLLENDDVVDVLLSKSGGINVLPKKEDNLLAIEKK